MLTKTDPDEIQSFLSDASHMREGHAERVVFPESDAEVADVLRAASESHTPVTVSGAGTGTVGRMATVNSVRTWLGRLQRSIPRTEQEHAC
jgi:FAD/FMN-containing dehydrogenase